MDLEDEILQMHLLNNYTTNSAQSQAIYKLLLNHLRTKNIRHFKNLIEQSLKKEPPSIDINYAYPDCSDETCLDIACKNGLSEFVKILLENGAMTNRINKNHNRGPIHFATENGYMDVLTILLNEATINPNLEAGGQTALHMAVKKNDLNCSCLLLEKGASPNIPNNKGLTALHMAAMKKQAYMVNLIMEKTKHVLDLDTYKDYNGSTTREVLNKNLPEIQLPCVEKRGVNVHDLKYYLNANDETNFLQCLSIVHDDIVSDVMEDLIEMAVQRNFKNTVVALLEKCRRHGYNLENAANLAVEQGLPDILQEILNTEIKLKSDILLKASMELGISGKEGSQSMKNRLECLKLILEREDVDVRCNDNKGNTPLHYAARANCREAVTLLLEKGSYIGHMNNFGVPPVADISISALSQCFDNFIQAKKERTNEYTIEFDYTCIMPHSTGQIGNSQKSLVNQGQREMDIFRYIASSSGLKQLLKHPLLTSFLYLKWHRIRHLLYLNSLLYILFYLLLNSYILHITYIRDQKMLDNSSMQTNEKLINNSTSLNILHISTSLILVILTFRETLQFVSSPCHYVSTIENWMEMTLIVLGFAILNGMGAKTAAIAILLSAWELVILIGKHPRMSTGIEMFKTVSFNFMRFLFLYAFLILAFAFAFFTLFKDSDDENFPDPGHSLFKTIIMLTGEFDANDIPFVSHPVLSRFIFILFVFLIAIVLFNLLNGLAVSDTADILGKAELIGLISRIKVLVYIENIVVQTPLTRRMFCSTCYGFLHRWKWNPLSMLAQRILLFPRYLMSGKLSVKPYDSLEDYGDRLYHERRTSKNIESKIFFTSKMDPDIIKQAKEVLLRRGHKSETQRIISDIATVKEKTNSIEIILNVIKQRLDNNNFNVTSSNGN